MDVPISLVDSLSADEPISVGVQTAQSGEISLSPEIQWNRILPIVKDINFDRKKFESNIIKKGDERFYRELLDSIESDYQLLKKKEQFQERLRNKRTELSSQFYKTKNQDLLKESQKNKEEIIELDKEIESLKKNLFDKASMVPNPSSQDAPEGKDEDDNILVSEGTISKRKFEFKPKDHVTLGESLEILDIKRAAKVSGARFAYLMNEAAILELALIQYTFDKLTKKSFKPTFPPTLIKKENMWAMGYISGHDISESYITSPDQYYLTATSEQSIGPFFEDEILDSSKLPQRFLAFSSCYRREAGTYGRDTKGLFRVHQFDKLEMFSFTLPNQSRREHEFFIEIEKEFFDELEIPFRVMEICTGELGFVAAKKYDLEAWIPSEGKYREVTSTSNTTDFQSRRLNIKYKEGNKSEFVHMINGTAFAIGRTLIAIMENYQQKDGSIEVPKVLQKYTGFSKIPAK